MYNKNKAIAANTLFNTLLLLAIIGASSLVWTDLKITNGPTNLGSNSTQRTPDGVLEIVGGTGTKPTLVICGADSTSSQGTFIGGTTPSMVVQSDGNVGIGTLAPAPVQWMSYRQLGSLSYLD